MISFRVIKQSKKSSARLGLLRTPHGVVRTPAFVPVATQAVIKTLTSDEADATGTQLAICNTFHLHRKPGEAVVAHAGGLHRFMAWQKPLFTDSGGFQVFSLGFGKDLNTGKVSRGRRQTAVRPGHRPNDVTITSKGAWFRSPVGGQRVFLGPRESIRIQERLGADIMLAFDECPPPSATKAYQREAMERTHAWARTCLQARHSRQALFGIVQGGRYADLRRISARTIGRLPFDGFAIGGEFGANLAAMRRMIETVTAELPAAKPRHLLGIGHLKDIPEIIRAGVDTFDCIVPTHYARHGTAFTSSTRIDLGKRTFLRDRRPLDRTCRCSVCQTYTRAYISHLVRAREITGLKLLTFHNLFFFNAFVERLRGHIAGGRL